MYPDLKDLVRLGLWTNTLKNKIIEANGSIQNITEIPDDIKEIYKTVWEIKQRSLIDMAADRGAFICQSQSLNLFIQEPTTAKLTSMHFYSWKKGLKTGMYYLRTQAAASAVKFTVEKQAEVMLTPITEHATVTTVTSNTLAMASDPVQDETFSEGASCTLDDDGNCLVCSS